MLKLSGFRQFDAYKAVLSACYQNLEVSVEALKPNAVMSQVTTTLNINNRNNAVRHQLLPFDCKGPSEFEQLNVMKRYLLPSAVSIRRVRDDHVWVTLLGASKSNGLLPNNSVQSCEDVALKPPTSRVGDDHVGGDAGVEAHYASHDLHHGEADQVEGEEVPRAPLVAHDEVHNAGVHHRLNQTKRHLHK